MHDASAAWLMTGLAPSPLMVSLMQTATSLPFFLLALPAGALADIVDRRRLLLVTQAWMLVAATALGVCTVAGLTGPWLLLSLTFCMGLGNALNAPAWQATTPDLVPRQELAGAVALLPLFARRGLELSATGYGLLLGCLGAGAIAGAAFLPRIRARLTSDRLVLAGTGLFAAVSAAVALARVPLVAGAGLFVGGMAW